MKKTIIYAAALAIGQVAAAFEVTSFDTSRSVALTTAFAADTVVKQTPAEILDYAVGKPAASVASAPAADGKTLNILTFAIENRRYSTGTLKVEGPETWAVSIDGERLAGGDLKLKPATHKVEVRYLGPTDSLRISVDPTKDGSIWQRTDGKRMFTLSDVLHGKRVVAASVSPSGKYLLVTNSDTRKGGATAYGTRLYDIASRRFAGKAPGGARWMPRTDSFYEVREDFEHGRHIVVVDPATGAESVMAEKIPEGDFVISPTEDFLLYSMTRKGKKADSDVYQVLEPEDRQSGWRDRIYPAIYRLDTGVLLPIATGADNLYPADISADGTKVLLMSSRTRLEKRPTIVSSIIVLDTRTLNADTIVADDGFIGSASFCPQSATKILVPGTPEAFGRIGCILPDSVTPSMTEQELFIVDITQGCKVSPLTRDFAPSIESAAWSAADGNIYFTAEDRDKVRLFSLNPATGKIRAIDVPDDVIKGFDVANNAPVLAAWGQSVSQPDALYTVQLKSGRATLVERPSASRLADVSLGDCRAWDFVNSRGDTICGRYYLPDDFDPSKKYPLIVNYYGGCSPTSRTFDGRYPHHAYASQGYVVYVVEPSGATGFGQEFASRHVNTAGKGVAEDIIEGTKQFCAAHPFVDASKIGCIGASYGGFMTQYLQTVTDIFAAAISHAGISDHTSYWGEGYWGYSYSEVSMAGSYPWSDPDLYVKQSPLYNADKVHTPILFLHGDADTNVPVGESIQMFTALKLLGRETALVQVAGENHHILDYGKRIKWQDTIFAWFAKYLLDDPQWWDSMYSDK